MRVEVVYALPQRQQLLTVELAPGSTVRDAILASGLHDPPSQVDTARVGIWGRRVGMETGLRDGDRVEIYRLLVADPKVIRRERAAKARK